MGTVYGDKFRIDLKGLADTYIAVGVQYRRSATNDSTYGGIYLTARPIEVAKYDGIEGMRFANDSCNRLFFEPATQDDRLNRKRLAAVLEQARADVANRSGPGWDVIKPILDINGYEVADEATATQEAL